MITYIKDNNDIYAKLQQCRELKKLYMFVSKMTLLLLIVLQRLVYPLISIKIH